MRPNADPAKAKALIQQSGVAHPKLALMVQNRRRPAAARRDAAIDGGDVGIDLTLQQLEFQTQLAHQASGDYQASLIGWSGRVDPDGNTYTLLGCKSPTNDGRYCGGAEQYLLAGQAETDRDEAHRGLSPRADHHRR